jgi:hypothetical protein
MKMMNRCLSVGPDRCGIFNHGWDNDLLLLSPLFHQLSSHQQLLLPLEPCNGAVCCSDGNPSTSPPEKPSVNLTIAPSAKPVTIVPSESPTVAPSAKLVTTARSVAPTAC